MKKATKDAVYAALAAAGFVEDDSHPIHDQVEALSENGPFVVHGAWSKDGVRVHLEQNTGPESPDDEHMTVYPPVLVIENDKGGRVAVNTHDLEAFASVLSGDVAY